MKKFLKFLYQSAGLCFDSIVALLSVLMFSSFKSNRVFKQQCNLYNDSDCFILGNGSSLAAFLEDCTFEDKNIMVVNFFASTPYFKKIKPNFYIVLDNILIGRSERQSSKEKVEKLYNDLLSVNWPITFLYPSNGDKGIFELLRKNKFITTIKYNMTPVSGIKGISHWLYRKSLGMPLPQNISNAAVFCAINLGFKKVYLYGVEHSWMKSFDVHPEYHRIYMNDGHFYEKENIRWFNRGDYCNWLKYIHRAMLSHFELRDYADSLGVKVINKTSKSFIEAYEFEEY